MGIDLVKRGRIRKVVRKDPRSNNMYLRQLVKLYKFLSRRTDSQFDKTVLHRMCSPRQFQRPVSLSKVSRVLSGRGLKASENIVVVVGTITNDNRFLDLPQGLKVCALSVTEVARKRIVEKGGEVLTFDQLALASPEGKGCVLLRGSMKTEKRKRFGTPGAIGSHTKPKKLNRKDESARGRRASTGYKKR